MSEIFSQQFIVPQATIVPANSTTALLFTNLPFMHLASFDSYIPVASIVKFLIYMGWFKIGLSLMNPLREDQSGFPMEEIFESNLKTSTKIALCPSNKLPGVLN
ncbi:unnamed protein product [Protopolystoma xenopodis]|uniref:Bestrophin homolog n=1 Tax=Protopolystoma xenopodis TaxID=117903 RepID=A0A3S5AHL5_9PLAT|nr:unnamed protein product [Protopolystoma xenopodis]